MTADQPTDRPHRPCPICGGPASMSRDNRARPFCSVRCQQLDLAGWLGEEYVVPGPSWGAVPSAPDDDDDAPL